MRSGFDSQPRLQRRIMEITETKKEREQHLKRPDAATAYPEYKLTLPPLKKGQDFGKYSEKRATETLDFLTGVLPVSIADAVFDGWVRFLSESPSLLSRQKRTELIKVLADSLTPS